MLSSVELWRDINGTRMPAMIYATAYKRHHTATLVECVCDLYVESKSAK